MANFIDKDRQQLNGIVVSNSSIFMRHGESGNIQGSTTGSIELGFDTIGLKLKRIEVFHSGSADKFGISLETDYFNSRFL